MGGFKNKDINVAFDVGIIEIIIAHLIKCGKKMKTDCVNSGNLLRNNEDDITNRLIAKYLNAEANDFRYETQSAENFDDKTGRFIGRTDIKVISRDYFHNFLAYHIVECKRIDGTDKLNKKYIEEGVKRFFYPTPKPKYSSYYNQNIMFGYLVEIINIPDNTDKISKLQDSLLKEVTVKEFVLQQNDDSQYYLYLCEYISKYIGQVELSHLFFNLADAICKE
jgi:hypothetical protein